MAKYIIRVSETIEHNYTIEADSAEEAKTKYECMTYDELAEVDEINCAGCDTPWDIDKVED